LKFAVLFLSGALSDERAVARLKFIKSIKNLSCHSPLLELITSLLIRGILMGEMSKLALLVGMVKHFLWPSSLYFLYLLLLSISNILASSLLTL
jgi:hypothetical protein